jgi:uncharacterized protein YdaU (DUF1376 family)
LNTYNHHLGDYAKDTKELTPLEHGCYRLLLDYNYATEKPVPNDRSSLYRIVGAVTPAERKAVDKVAERFFPVNGDGRRHNKRADEEITKAQEYARSQAMRAHKRWHQSGSAGEMPPHMPPHESGMPSGNAIRTLIPEDSKARETSSPLSEPAVPDCPHEAILALYAKWLPTLTQPRLWSGQRAEALRMRWRECSKRNAVWPGYSSEESGLAFWDQFFSDVARSKTLTEGIARGDGSRWRPDLPWLLKRENFAKVIEGKYHQ